MWQRFSERARRVVFYARQEAQRFGEGYVSTEHVLLGLLRDADTVAQRMIEYLGVSANRLRAEVERQLPRGDARPSQDMTFTPRAKRVIDLAYAEARALGDSTLGTEHLLLGLVREGDGLAGRVLAKLGIDLKEARHALESIREGEGRPVRTGGEEAEALASRQNWAFLTGSCLQEHLMLALLADDDQVRTIARKQDVDIGSLQVQLIKEVADAAAFGPYDPVPQHLEGVLAQANEEARGGPLQPKHLLLALLADEWKAFRFGNILQDAGFALERSRELAEMT